MVAFLKFIEVENFKSYKGHIVIGKSNFMDAISFVMGEKTISLRVKRLGELIHGAAIGRPVSNRCSVTAKFELDDGTYIEFQRSVINSSADYKINGKGVQNTTYLEQLESMGINVKAKNFLVFQGAVESIAMKNAKERTALFEEISGSGLLKEDYNRLKQEMIQAEEETQFTYQKKKGVAAERKEAKAEKQEADRYARLKEEFADKQVEFQLFRLYHFDKEIQRLRDEMQAKQDELQAVEQKKLDADDVLKEKKKDTGKISRELAKLEQDIREVDTEMSKKHPLFIKAKEKVSHSQKKLNSAQKSLEQSRKADEAHQLDIKKLQDEIKGIETAKQKFEAQIESESQKRGSNVHLEQGHVEEYDRLKQEAEATAAKYVSEQESINREQKSDQDLLDNEINKKEQIEGQLEKNRLEKEEVSKRMEKLLDHIQSSKQALQDQNRIKDELKNDVGSSKERIAEIHKELDNVRDQLGDAKGDKHEDARRKKKQEVVELFKREVPGVYDRMINMCQPTHKRYNVAVTKVLGKYMEAIIVDTEKTARRCIQILKEQMLEVETFLPLDYLQAKPLKQRLRDIREPKQVKLVYDVLKFDPPEIEKAVLFATNNALVCETPEDAMKVAYEIDRSRYDALALDGTSYQKSGIISGGSHDLTRKAKRWDEKHMAQLKLQKEKYSEELKDLIKKSRKGSELSTVESQIKGLENRLKYSQKDWDASKKLIQQYDKKLADLEEELNAVGPLIGRIERKMVQRNQKIQEIKQKMNNVEDHVYADFCARIGVANIRQYEERELVLQQERAKIRADFDQQIDRIASRLDFEKTKDTQVNVQRWERSVQDEEDFLQRCKQAESKHKAEIETDKLKIEQLKQEKNEKKKVVDQMEEETAKARRDVAALAKELHNINYVISTIDTKIETKKNEKHNLLIQSKMDDIKIPMISGNIDEFEGDNPNESETTRDIQIDFSSLSRQLKDLRTNESVKKMHDNLNKDLQSKQEVLERIQAPNMKAMQKLETVSEKIAATNEEFENARRKAKKAKLAFEKVKTMRFTKFKACYDHISDAIDGIYKSLARNEAAQAYLCPDNPEEPYLEGINYNCVAPGKRFQPMSNLSGGEKTIAALALLFAIHSFQPAPFFVLDEIDAALDNTNIGKVASYIVEKTTNLQTIVISLKEEFYGHAESLIGISPHPGDCLISGVFHYDLTVFGDFND
ncbi:Structural maintenance of chromosomes protein 1A [Pseudolycoriella hygida]|uniref:Structural maintenance of chromosomes protein n=1 Tax=Pseudolycoriella hygida TaxID=35572 RepID=A0A9Q0MJQ4_9DIPT|nr:Structural maintenance of chromosomes protein 1A [Pseudolycoriella hygida]